MAQSKLINLRFPTAGVVRRLGFGSAADLRDAAHVGNVPAYGAPWAVNMRPEDTLARRLRGGSIPASRPTAATYTPGAPTPVALATDASVALATDESVALYIDLPTSIAGETASDIGCRYRDRLVKVDTSLTNAIKMSRQGDYDDWDYGDPVDDPGRAVFVQLSEGGEVGAAVTCVVPHKDAFLLAATATTLWIVRGDPAATGTMRNVSRNVGIVSRLAWAKIEDSVVFLADDGIYLVGADGSEPTNLSLDRIPEELLDVDSATLGYSHGDNGVYIFATTDAVETAWFFDLGSRGFWPMDDAAPGTSHLLIGPIQLWSPTDFGQIQSIAGILSEDSGSVTWRIVAGSTAEDACENAKTAIGLFQAGNTSAAAAYAAASGTWTAGRSRMAYPRTRAMWAVLWLQATAPWAYEGVSMTITPFGRWR
jgi:hypothetical protein